MTVFKDLQKHHEHLLRLQESDDDNVEAVGEYISQVRHDSTLISSPQERDTLRANLRYWASYIYGKTGTYPNTELLPVKPSIEKKRIFKQWFFAAFKFSLLFLGFLYLVSPSLRLTIIRAVGTTLLVPPEITFAGQVEDVNGDWVNDYVVVLFKNGDEISRTKTDLLNSPLSNAGPLDGVFEFKITNEYKLSLDSINFGNIRVDEPVRIYPQPTPGLFRIRSIGYWVASSNPNSVVILSVPEKQLEYAIVVLPFTSRELPESFQAGNLRFVQGLLITTNPTDK